MNDPRLAEANTALGAYQIAGQPLAQAVADAALRQVNTRFAGPSYDIVIIDRAGVVLARAGA